MDPGSDVRWRHRQRNHAGQLSKKHKPLFVTTSVSGLKPGTVNAGSIKWLEKYLADRGRDVRVAPDKVLRVALKDAQHVLLGSREAVKAGVNSVVVRGIRRAVDAFDERLGERTKTQIPPVEVALVIEGSGGILRRRREGMRQKVSRRPDGRFDRQHNGNSRLAREDRASGMAKAGSAKQRFFEGAEPRAR